MTFEELQSALYYKDFNKQTEHKPSFVGEAVKGNSRRRMVSLSRKRVKVSQSLMVVMLLQLGVTTVRRKVIPEKYAPTDRNVMAMTRIMAMQPLCKMIMNHLIFLWFQAATLEKTGLWIQGVLST